MQSVHEACAAIMTQARPLATQQQPLAAAHGRFLAHDVHARHALPGFDNSAMDGYAVRYQEVAGAMGASLPVHGESRAGGPAPAALPPASAMRIFTGAPMPAGADTVVIQENAKLEGERVRFTKAPGAAGQHVRRRGSDIAEGQLALLAGRRLAAGELALLAGQGYAQVPVHGRPRVAILSTGDELCDVAEAGTPGRVVNSNAYALAAQVEEAGCEPWVLPTARDRVEDIARRLDEALTADVVISAGGVSVGTYDLVGAAFGDAGIRSVFWKVAVKPGKPLLFGMADRTPVFGLPGNPGAAMVTFEAFVRPMLRVMLGDPTPYRECVDVVLDVDVRHGHARTELVRAVLTRVDAGAGEAGGGAMLHARPNRDQGSGSLLSMAAVDALLVLPPGPDVYPAGTCVRAMRVAPAASARPTFGPGTGA